MSIKKRLTRKWHKNVLRYGTDVQEEILNKDDDGTIWPDKRDWGYCVSFKCNGWTVTCPDDSWYRAYQGANMCIKDCLKNSFQSK